MIFFQYHTHSFQNQSPFISIYTFEEEAVVESRMDRFIILSQRSQPFIDHFKHLEHARAIIKSRFIIHNGDVSVQQFLILQKCNRSMHQSFRISLHVSLFQRCQQSLHQDRVAREILPRNVFFDNHGVVDEFGPFGQEEIERYTSFLHSVLPKSIIQNLRQDFIVLLSFFCILFIWLNSPQILLLTLR